MTNMPERLPGSPYSKKTPNVEGFDKFKETLGKQTAAPSVPEHSRNIAPAIHNTAKDIPLANKETN